MRLRLRSVRSRLAERLFGDVICRRVQQAVQAVDDEYWSQVQGGSAGRLDPDWSEQQADLREALEAWRTNPLARRIVTLTTDYVVGTGLAVRSPWTDVQRFVDEFWALNGMARRCYDWCDELTRAGELFLMLRTDPASGTSFVRALPALRIVGVECDEEDLERELSYREAVPGRLEGRNWPSYLAAPEAEQVMLHYAVNRPVGAVRGCSDLQPILPWLRRYSDWLLNRVRLNKFKTAFLWDVTVSTKPGRGDTLRKKRFRYQSPPLPGSIVVHGEDEQWSAVSPKIEAWDAKEDGRALRLAVAAGAGVPLHFLSEGEGTNRATAAEMGDPTFRHYHQRQLLFGQVLADLLATAWRRANAVGRGRPRRDPGLSVTFPDVTRADNLTLARSAWLITQALEVWAERGWVDRATALKLALHFGGELVDAEEVLRRVEEAAQRSSGRGDERGRQADEAGGAEP